MKTFRNVAIIALLLISKLSFCDITPANTTYVNVCVQITNLNDYTGVSFVGMYSPIYVLSNTPYSYIYNSTTIISSHSKDDSFELFAVRSSYLKGKNVLKTDWSKDNNALKTNIEINPFSAFMYNMSTVDSIKRYYKIVGFTDKNVVLYEWKEVTIYNNGQAEKVVLKSYSGDVSTLSQTITTPITGSSIQSNNSVFVIYPNPTAKELHLKISNNYFGNILVKITNAEGKVVKSSNVLKDTGYLDFLLYVDMLKKGSYVVSIIMGETVDSRLLMVE